MKILQINASYKPAYIYGGPALSISKLCEGLTKTGADLEVLTTTANGPTELDVHTNTQVFIDGVKVTFFKRLTKDHTHFSPGLLKRFRKIIVADENLKKERLIVHIHAWWNLVSVLSCWIAKAYGVPVVLTPRGTLSSYSFSNRNSGIKSYIHRYIGEPLLKYCHFHVTSEKEKEDILNLVRPKSIYVIPNFIFLPDIEKEPKSNNINQGKEQETKFLFLSRIEQKKGLEILLKALASINIHFTLDIAGSGEDAYVSSLKNLTEKLGIADKIHWLGQINQQDKWTVLKEHDMLLLTSYDENFANVIIECLATGTPVLTTSKVGLADYVIQNNFGWICDPQVSSIEATLAKAINDKATILYTKQQAPAKIRRDFDEHLLVGEFLKMYKKILGSSSL